MGLLDQYSNNKFGSATSGGSIFDNLQNSSMSGGFGQQGYSSSFLGVNSSISQSPFDTLGSQSSLDSVYSQSPLMPQTNLSSPAAASVFDAINSTAAQNSLMPSQMQSDLLGPNMLGDADAFSQSTLTSQYATPTPQSFSTAGPSIMGLDNATPGWNGYGPDLMNTGLNTFDTLGSRTSFGSAADVMAIRGTMGANMDLDQLFMDPQIAAKLQELGINQFNIQNLDPASMEALKEFIATGGLMSGGAMLGNTMKNFDPGDATALGMGIGAAIGMGVMGTTAAMGGGTPGSPAGAVGGVPAPGQPQAPLSAFQQLEQKKLLQEQVKQQLEANSQQNNDAQAQKQKKAFEALSSDGGLEAFQNMRRQTSEANQRSLDDAVGIDNSTRNDVVAGLRNDQSSSDGAVQSQSSYSTTQQLAPINENTAERSFLGDGFKPNEKVLGQDASTSELMQKSADATEVSRQDFSQQVSPQNQQQEPGKDLPNMAAGLPNGLTPGNDEQNKQPQQSALGAAEASKSGMGQNKSPFDTAQHATNPMSGVGPNNTPNAMEKLRMDAAEAEKKELIVWNKLSEMKEETKLKKAIRWSLNPINKGIANPYVTKENQALVIAAIKKEKEKDFMEMDTKPKSVVPKTEKTVDEIVNGDKKKTQEQEDEEQALLMQLSVEEMLARRNLNEVGNTAADTNANKNKADKTSDYGLSEISVGEDMKKLDELIDESIERSDVLEELRNSKDIPRATPTQYPTPADFETISKTRGTGSYVPLSLDLLAMSVVELSELKEMLEMRVLLTNNPTDIANISSDIKAIQKATISKIVK